MKRAVILGVVCVLALGLAPVGSLGAATSQQAAYSLTQTDFDRTTFTVTVAESGAARWEFRFSRTLENESERDAFAEYADRFNTNETDLYRNFVTNAETLTQNGENATGREMDATEFTRNAKIDDGLTGPGDDRGIVTMSFRWTGFAATSGDSVVVGDVFSGGFYIGPSQTFVIQPGDGLAFDSVTPDPTSQSNPDSLANSSSVTWDGERSFADGRPRIVFREAGTGGSMTDTQTTDGASVGGGSPLWPIALVAVAIAAGVGAFYHRRDTDSGGDTAGATSTSGSDDDETATPEPEPVSEEALMSDEERVISILEANGGRMKQTKIVDETGWSKAKVSMLLSEMEDEEELSKLRIGRENIVSLAGHEPDAAGSPFEDDENE